MKIGFIGTGKITSSIVYGISKSKLKISKIYISPRNKSTANKLSKKYLSKAKKNLGNHELFYISLEKSLHNYLKSKLHIQTADMSKDKVDELLEQRQASEVARKEFGELLASCEFARYTPSSEASMKEDYEKAGRVLNDIDKQLKK